MSICPSCLRDDVTAAAVDAVCGHCGARVVVAGRYRLDEFFGGDRSHDSVDGVGPLVVGADLSDARRVLVRLRGPDDRRDRLAREATIVKGLADPQLPALLLSTSEATVWAAPAGTSLDAAIAAGLRTDTDGVRRFLGSLLTVLAHLEEKSPPVHLCGLHAGNVVVDDKLRATLIDFSRATDTLSDVVDVTAVRPGMQVPDGNRAATTAASRDLYATGVLAVQLASRTAPSELPRASDGVPDVVKATRLDRPLQRFIDGLLHGGFASKQAALAALRLLDVAPSSSSRLPNAVGLWLVGVMAAVVVGSLLIKAGEPAPAPPDPPPPDPPPQLQPPDVLTVNVVPSGAHILLDDQAAQDVNVFVIPRGVHHVTARKDGYFDASADVLVQGPTTLTLTLTLVDPPKDPPKKDPPKTQEPPKTQDPLPPPSVDDALLRAIEVAVRAQRDEIEACPDDGTDRIKLHLVLKAAHGDIKPLARGDTDSVRCVADSVAASTWPKTPHQQVDADIWVWRKPAFKVAAY